LKVTSEGTECYLETFPSAFPAGRSRFQNAFITAVGSRVYFIFIAAASLAVGRDLRRFVNERYSQVSLNPLNAMKRSRFPPASTAFQHVGNPGVRVPLRSLLSA
jgi:hypothetical protein